MAAEISTKETGNQMKQTNALVFHVMQELRKDPRPTCLPCLGITAPEHWASVHTHIASQYSLQYRFEDGVCGKCQTKQDTISPRTHPRTPD
jgi:hypothetical protein